MVICPCHVSTFAAFGDGEALPAISFGVEGTLLATGALDEATIGVGDLPEVLAGG
jgi:hypothetical protein